MENNRFDSNNVIEQSDFQVNSSEEMQDYDFETTNNFLMWSQFIEEIEWNFLWEFDNETKKELLAEINNIINLDSEKAPIFLRWLPEISNHPDIILNFLNEFENITWGTYEDLFSVLNYSNENSLKLHIINSFSKYSETMNDITTNINSSYEANNKYSESERVLNDKALELQNDFKDDFLDLDVIKNDFIWSLSEERIQTINNLWLDINLLANIYATNTIISNSSNQELISAASSFSSEYSLLSSRLPFLDNSTASNLNKTISSASWASEFVSKNSTNISDRLSHLSDNPSEVWNVANEISNITLTKYWEYITKNLEVFTNYESTSDKMQVLEQEIWSNWEYSMKFKIWWVISDFQIDSKWNVYLTDYFWKENWAFKISMQKIEWVKFLTLNDFSSQVNDDLLSKANDISDLPSMTSDFLDNYSHSNFNNFSINILSSWINNISVSNEIFSHYKPSLDLSSYQNWWLLTKDQNPDLFLFAQSINNSIVSSSNNENLALLNAFDRLSSFSNIDWNFNKDNIIDFNSNNFYNFINNFNKIDWWINKFDSNKFINFVDSVYKNELFDLNNDYNNLSSNELLSPADRYLEEALSNI